MSSIDTQFEQVRSQGQVAFMPFITAGDPDLEFTADLIRALDQAGCSLIELGFPYSDPIADGPVIQESYTRALQKNVRVNEILKMVEQVSPTIQVPLVAMVSYAIIFRHGIETFLDQCRLAGVAGLIVPDLPSDESDELRGLCEARDLNLIPLITPTTTPARVAKILQQSGGFIYYVSIAGITGERTNLPTELADKLRDLRSRTKRPVCVGFGISDPGQAALLTDAADGVIVGSAIVRRIGELAVHDREAAIQGVVQFSQKMVASLKRG
ncbi:MAG: tryptophan synthase subunit alpha [Planctomycetota bacterium]|nr:tryptophan synthase subunit alpha [Planctomycetota bacterium]